MTLAMTHATVQFSKGEEPMKQKQPPLQEVKREHDAAMRQQRQVCNTAICVFDSLTRHLKQGTKH